MYNLQCVQNIRKVLSVAACNTLVHGLVTSHLDDVNALYCGLPDSVIRKLQQVQNAAARDITGKTQGKSINMCLKELHWLPV